MHHSKRLGKKINALHERALRITYGDKSSSFNEVVNKSSSLMNFFLFNNSVSIHHKNLQTLATEIYKVSNNISLTILNNIFASRATHYNLHNSVLKWYESIGSAIVLKLYPIQEQKCGV